MCREIASKSCKMTSDTIVLAFCVGERKTQVKNTFESSSV